MMESLRAWLLSLAGAALLTALAAMFPTSESLRRIVKLIGGVALTCLLFSPLVSFDYDSYAAALQSCRLAVQTDGAAPDCGDGLQRTVIESELRAYILDKARSLGASVTVKVSLEPLGDYYLRPSAVTICGAVTPAQQQALAQWLQEDLALTGGQVTWEE